MFNLWKWSTGIFIFQAIAFISGLAEGSVLIGLTMSTVATCVLAIVLYKNEAWTGYDVCRSAAAFSFGALLTTACWLLPGQTIGVTYLQSVIVIWFFWYGSRYMARLAATNLPFVPEERTPLLGWVAMPCGIGMLVGGVALIIRCFRAASLDDIIGGH